MSDLKQFLLDEDYIAPRQLPNGQWAAIGSLIFTSGLFVGLTKYGYDRRYCYEHQHEALAALDKWNGEGDPPGMWIKEKPSNRINPNIWNER